MATTRPSRTYTAGPDPRAADRGPCPRSSGWAFAAMGAIGRTALRRTADTAAVVVRQMECGFRFMILTFLASGSGSDTQHDAPGDGLRPPQMRHSERRHLRH